MNLACEKCQRRYNIPDERVRGRTVKVRCRHCQHLIVVGQEAVEVQAETRMMPEEQVVVLRKAVAPDPVEWLAMVKGQQEGPWDLHMLDQRIRSGEVSSRTWFWRKGMAEWVRGADLPELAQFFAAEAPPAAPSVRSPSFEDLFSDPDLVSDIEPSAPDSLGDQTRFFIAQAGVDRRNPPWKIAAFIGGGVAAVVGALYLLSTLQVVPLEITRVDASGHEVQQSVFTAEGARGLGDLLLGRKKTKPQPVAVAPAAKPASPARPVEAPRPKVEVPAKPQPPSEELAALYGDETKKTVAPAIRKGVEEKATDTNSGGPSDESVSKVVGTHQAAFQLCIEQELRKNPNLRVPKFNVVATVASSGVVTKASIDRKEIEGSALGDCLRTRARRMVFASFSGDEVDIEIPLVVGVAM